VTSSLLHLAARLVARIVVPVVTVVVTVIAAGLAVAAPPPAAATGPAVASSPSPTVPTLRPPEDPQAVVVEVPTRSPSTPTTNPCPQLTRGDFEYRFIDDGTPATSVAVPDWTAPLRLDLERPPLTATITLNRNVVLPEGAACRYAFTYASYAAEGPTWETSGRLTLVDLVTDAIDAASRSITLVVKPPPCVGQIDLWAGTQRFDGTADPLPRYPEPVPPDVSVATWNGDRDCVGDGVVADLVPFPVPSCPGQPLSWLVVNPNGLGVEASVVLEGSVDPDARRTLLAPGVTTIVAASAEPVVLVLSWTRDDGGRRTVRQPSAAPLAPGTPEFGRRCEADEPGVTMDKTADPEEGRTLSPGASVRWTIVVVNTGTTALSGVEVLDVVPAYARVTDPGGAEVRDGGTVLSWVLSLAPGQRVEVGYSGVVVEEVPAGVDLELVNTAVLPVMGLSDTTRHPLAVATGTGTVTGSPTTGTSVAPGGPPGPRGPLSFTGSNLVGLLVAATGALLLGLLLLRLSRRGRGRILRGSRVV
jgi:uncharacterized repeat protein (TIGR01451 family)